MVMKLSEEVLNELISQVVRKDAVAIVNLLRGKKNVSEVKLAEKLKLTINQIRSLLYSLSNYGLVTNIRKKDKKKGWYVYFWNFEEETAFKLKHEVNQKKLDELKSQLKIEEKINYYICPDECERVSSEDALECNFKCPDCGKLMVQESNIPGIIKIREEIKKIQNELTEEKLEIQKDFEKKIAKTSKKIKKIVKKTKKAVKNKKKRR